MTDRHPQISKWLKETHPNRHYYDVWHVAKGKHEDNYVFCFVRYGYKFMSTIGLGKKIEVLAKQRDCDDVWKWERVLLTTCTGVLPQLQPAKYNGNADECLTYIVQMKNIQN